MEFLNEILNSISAKPRKGVGYGIYISPSSFIEVVEYDFDIEEITNYNKIEFEYDSILREINVDNFEIALQNLLRPFDVTSQTPIVLSLPSVFINRKFLPVELEYDEINTALMSEAEKNYIFKKSEPKVSWNIISTDKETHLNTFIFSALQKNLVERIEEVFNRQGLRLAVLESSYPTFIRGLAVSGLVNDFIENNLSWCSIIVRNNINTIITLKGAEITNISESPLALKSLEVDDLYPNLSSSILEKIQDTPVETMVIVNYSAIINPEKLAKFLNFNCPYIEIEKDNYGGDPMFPYGGKENIKSVSPEVVGAACYKSAPVKFGFNFSSGDSLEVEVPDFLANIGVIGNPVHLVILTLISISLFLIFFISLIAIPINAALDTQYRKLYIQCEKYKANDKPQQKPFDIFNVVQKGFDDNEKIITSYDSISSVIPEKVWITSINIDENLNADIVGRAYSIEDIVLYYQNLLSVAKFENLKIKSIRVVGDTIPRLNNNLSANLNNSNSGSVPGQGQAAGPLAPQPLSAPGGSSLLPLPPVPSSGLETSIPIISGQKYYEFDFGNPLEPKKNDKTNATGTNQTDANKSEISQPEVSQPGSTPLGGNQSGPSQPGANQPGLPAIP